MGTLPARQSHENVRSACAKRAGSVRVEVINWRRRSKPAVHTQKCNHASASSKVIGTCHRFLVSTGPFSLENADATAKYAERDQWWQKAAGEGECDMRRLAPQRGRDWDKMTEAEREAFVDDLLHES
jgi:hypothetical protein